MMQIIRYNLVGSRKRSPIWLSPESKTGLKPLRLPSSAFALVPCAPESGRGRPLHIILGITDEFERLHGLDGNRGVLTPYAGMTLGDAGARTARTGAHWQLGPDTVDRWTMYNAVMIEQ